MKLLKKRRGFSMITAIVVIVLMATVAVFVLSLSGKVVKSSTAQYQHEQAVLYAKSYTEYAILAVTGNNRADKCLQTIKGSIGSSPINGKGYEIRTEISYIGPASVVGNCASKRILSTNVNTTQTPLTIIIDAYVNYKDPDNPSGPWFTVHRRTIQKI
ncbi:type II secretion system protein [Nitratifractor sp.]